jgi:hypothetical protein
MAEQVGTIQFLGGKLRENFDVAAWYREYECPPQAADVFLSRNPEGWPSVVTYAVEGICVDAFLGSLCCGMPIGKDTEGPREIGKSGRVTRSIYAYALPANLRLSPAYEWLRNEAEWPRHVADRRLQMAVRNRQGWASLARQFNVDWLKANGSPELVAQIQT